MCKETYDEWPLLDQLCVGVSDLKDGVLFRANEAGLWWPTSTESNWITYFGASCEAAVKTDGAAPG